MSYRAEVTSVITSPIRSSNKQCQMQGVPVETQKLLDDIWEHIDRHGDGLKDVAFEVNDVEAVYTTAIQNGAEAVSPPSTSICEKVQGEVLTASIKTYGDTTHTSTQWKDYAGVFLHDYRASPLRDDPVNALLPSVDLIAIDHCVGNQDWDAMDAACEYHSRCLGFYRF